LDTPSRLQKSHRVPRIPRAGEGGLFVAALRVRRRFSGREKRSRRAGSGADARTGRAHAPPSRGQRGSGESANETRAIF